MSAEQLAREFLLALKLHGWRPTPAGQAPPWQTTERPADEATVHQRAAEIRATLPSRRRS